MGVFRIQLDMNTHKEESTEQLKGLEMKIIDLNNKFMVSYANFLPISPIYLVINLQEFRITA
jgi:hypothetical protein